MSTFWPGVKRFVSGCWQSGCLLICSGVSGKQPMFGSSLMQCRHTSFLPFFSAVCFITSRTVPPPVLAMW